MKRRDFLKSLTAGSLGVMLGNGLSIQLAHAAGPIDPYRKFVFVYFSGAWDVLLGLDPRNPDIFTEERIDETGIQPACTWLKPVIRASILVWLAVTAHPTP